MFLTLTTTQSDTSTTITRLFRHELFSWFSLLYSESINDLLSQFSRLFSLLTEHYLSVILLSLTFFHKLFLEWRDGIQDTTLQLLKFTFWQLIIWIILISFTVFIWVSYIIKSRVWPFILFLDVFEHLFQCSYIRPNIFLEFFYWIFCTFRAISWATVLSCRAKLWFSLADSWVYWFTAINIILREFWVPFWLWL